MKFLDSTNAEQELVCKESNNFTGSSQKIQSEEHVTSEIHMGEENSKGCPSLQLCIAEPTSTLQVKIVPLEGKPDVTIIMGDSNVNRQFILVGGSIGNSPMKFLDSTNAEQELDCKESNNFTGSSQKIQSEEHVASEIHTSEESNEGYSALRLCIEEPTSTLQDKIVPLEGKPYFTIIMGETNVNRQFILKIPTSFLGFLPSSSISVVLCCREKEWVVQCSVHHNTKIIRKGWKEFVMDNNLRLGDGCVFELLDDNEMKFRVQILSGEVPISAIATDGINADNPIVID